eukprot:TRINITY_DN9461_c0_g1_i1.p1 TRINITY_DN9461_c0_g1~~TRINITY_DN9461_c0_g1_i1.p1  ORF type:complete len:103 (-),score=7.43 TRINITY_DN9461_c0_g1_i1:153-461(-)
MWGWSSDYSSHLWLGQEICILEPYCKIGRDNETVIDSLDPQRLISISQERVKVCAVCLKTSRDDGKNLLYCGKCKTTYYCSKECQLIDFKNYSHKYICIPAE